MHLKPDVILDIVPHDYMPADDSIILKDWKNSSIDLFKETKIHLIQNDYVSIPGPRFLKIIKLFLKVLHPDVFNNLYNEKINDE